MSFADWKVSSQPPVTSNAGLVRYVHILPASCAFVQPGTFLAPKGRGGVAPGSTHWTKRPSLHPSVIIHSEEEVAANRKNTVTKQQVKAITLMKRENALEKYLGWSRFMRFPLKKNMTQAIRF